ncbi:YobI family P-loop NTPase [Leucobacter sp. BZR 635]
MTNIELRSLAPEYDADHHQSYVSRLNAAVSDLRNRNIALTGRYGAGKSSILDAFIKGRETFLLPAKKKWGRKRSSPTKVLRISINTLGPDKGEDLTNRIQKELVKQLVYRAKPGEVRSSEFSRAPELTWWQAGFEALIVAVALVGVLWLFGLRPKEDSLGTDGFLLPLLVFFLLVFAILWAIRWYMGSRVVAQVSAGGASIALEGKNDSFFDKYLDELIAFFEATEPDIVVFEDLDRFDDPRIFDSLRELNTLVNTSAHWMSRPERPLRFVYAIKDSLFEKLGDKQQQKDVDGEPEPEECVDELLAWQEKGTSTATQAVERANRTKFFELVIPVVQFLSHSNARDHFLTELGKLKLPKGSDIDHGLIDIVARHTTDMRLMINIGNEFIVYAERLLWVEEKKVAPGLTADLLFALVVYKNFHLKDFEALPNRGSALDTLDQSRRDLVNASIKRLQDEHVSLVRGTERQRKQQDLAAILGRRLSAVLVSTGMTLQEATALDVRLDTAMTDDRAFWGQVGRAGSLELSLHHRNSGHTESPRFGPAELKELFPEAASPSEWLDSESTPADLARINEIDAEIATLRGEDYKNLIDDERYEHNGEFFSEIAARVLPSGLALDLVKRGKIDRYYAEYATVFFGEFLGVDVAKFFRNCVWPNKMEPQFEFTTAGAVENVLAQAPADFLHTRSALNIDIVNYLMGMDAVSSSALTTFLARPNNSEGKEFLATYFKTKGSRSKEIVSRLAAKPWPELFSFIASEGTIETDAKSAELLHAALMSAPAFEAFEVDDAARALIRRLHTEIPAFRDPQPRNLIKTCFNFLTDAVPSIPALRVISPALQEEAVRTQHYDLSIGNIRNAARLRDEQPISADSLITKPEVWTYCADNLDIYLELVESDNGTSWSCVSPEVLAQVIEAQHEAWSTGQMEAFLNSSAEGTALSDIAVIPQTVWQTAAETSRMTPNVVNLEQYTTEIGVDVVLASLLTENDGTVVNIIGLEDATEEQLDTLITLFLNAEEVFDSQQRVMLAKQLWTHLSEPGLYLDEITASPDGLLAELLREEMADDSEEVFAHFSEAGWPSIGPALQVSTNAATFLTPELIEGHAAELVRNNEVPEATRKAVLDRLTEFAQSEGQGFLAAAASVARALNFRLSVEALELIAPTSGAQVDLLWQLHEQRESISAATGKRILGSMPGDFAGFAGATGQKFEVADVAFLKASLVWLKDAGEIVFQPGRQPAGRWKLKIV